MSYKTWNDFFRNYHDDKKTNSNSENLMDDIDNFELEYKTRFGAYIDHHALELTKQYGPEKAWKIINNNIQTLNNEKRAAIEAAKHKYDWHPVPDNVAIPF